MNQISKLEKRIKYAREKTPICTFTKVTNGFRCYPNKAARSFLKNIGLCGVDWQFNSEVIACVPSSDGDSYKPAVSNGKFYGYYVPNRVYEKCPLIPGHYKMFRFKNGFLIKRSERLEDMNCEWN